MHSIRTRAAVVLTTLAFTAGGLVLHTAMGASDRTTPPPAPAPVCTSVRASLGKTEGAAGSTYQTIRLRNVADTRCVVNGFPHVAYVNRHKRMIGWPAAHDRTRKPAPVVLSHGEAARSVLRIPNPGNFSPIDCLAHNAHKIRVRVGRDKTPTFLLWDQVECTTRFGRSYVSPIH